MDVINSQSQPSTAVLKPISDAVPGSVSKGRHLGFGISVGLLAAAFLPQILAYLRFVNKSERFSYTLLIPLISAYFYWIDRKSAPQAPRRFSLTWPIPWVCFGLAFLFQYFRHKALPAPSPYDLNFFFAISFVCFFMALVFGFYGPGFARVYWFPLAFLFLVCPFPKGALDSVEIFLQSGSAEVTAWLYSLLNVPHMREDNLFQLPGLAIRVAQECSGIHSTLVLAITGILAARLLLFSSWSRAAILACLLPLALLRNAIRIVTISLLTIYYDPGIIHGPLHKQGGPVFFAMSLVMLLGLILVLRKLESKGRARPSNLT